MTRSTAQIMEWKDPLLVEQLEAYAKGWWWSFSGGIEPQPKRVTSDYKIGTYHGFVALSQTEDSPFT